MNYMKRALLSVWKKKFRSILLTVVFLIVATLIFSSISIRSAVEREQYDARMSIGSSVTLQFDTDKKLAELAKEKEKAEEEAQKNGTTIDETKYSGFQSEGIKPDAYNNLKNLSYVKNYNLLNSDVGKAVSFKPIVSDDSYDTLVLGFSDTSISNEFASGEYKLIEGRHITKADDGKQVAIISKQLADKNKLKLGDSISIKSIRKNPANIKLTVVGIFAEPNPKTSSEQVSYSYASFNPSSRVYVDFKDSCKLDTTNKDEAIMATFMLDDITHINQFKKDAAKYINMDEYTALSNEDLYNQMAGPLGSVSSLMNLMVLFIIIAGCVVMSLIIALTLKERGHEFGVLLSVGEKKLKIITQVFFEVLIPIIIAFCIAVAANGFVAQQAGNKIIENEVNNAKQVTTTVKSNGSVTSVGGYVLGDLNTDPTSKFNIAVTPTEFGEFAGVALLIALISIIIPSVFILRFNPRKILVKG